MTINEGTLYTTIMDKLNFEPRLDASNVTVAIRKDGMVVVLGGSTKSYAEKLVAENVVKGIDGVKAVANEIKVDASAAYKRGDIDIAKAAIDALQWNVMIPEDRIKVVVESGLVTLSGNVEWQHQRYSAWKAVSNLWGVKSVTNNITIKPIAIINAHTVKEYIKKESEYHARIDASKIVVEVDGSKIILKGYVRNLEEADEAVDAAWSIPGVSAVKDELIID